MIGPPFRRLLIAITILATWLSACSVSETANPPSIQHWLYNDLRLIDPVDSADSLMDLQAVYLRARDGMVSLRLDLLELAVQPDFDLYLAIDSTSGGSDSLPIAADPEITWDSLLVIPASGQIRIYSAGSYPHEDETVRPGIQVLRDPILAVIQINLQRESLFPLAGDSGELPAFRLQTWLTPSGQIQPVDSLRPVRSHASPPAALPVLYVFWDTFPAYTPAQALRRWDGAHTGPNGGRHGLYNLLRTARAANVPITLLDFDRGANWATLDFMDTLDILRNASIDGQVSTPLSLPVIPHPLLAWQFNRLVEESQQTRQAFNIPGDPALYAPQGLGQLSQLTAELGRSLFELVFVPGKGQPGDSAWQTDLYRWGSLRLLPVPSQVTVAVESQQAGLSGPGLDVRRALTDHAALLNSANTVDSPAIHLLGGSLPASAWGDPQAARSTFAYLNARLWLRSLSQQELISMPVSSGAVPLPSAVANHLPGGLHLKPVENTIGKAAWDSYLAQYAPVYPPSTGLTDLRNIYARQVAWLGEAARWGATPYSTASCDQDINQDGEAECLLTSPRFWALILPQDGSLVFLFYRSAFGSLHQVIGASSQKISGTSEPATWDLAAGLAADPSVIPGAFSLSTADQSELMNLTISVQSDQITFSAPAADSAASAYQITYTLLPDGLQVQQTMLPSGSRVLIPVLLDPWEIDLPGWADRFSADQLADGWDFNIQPGMSLRVRSSNPLQLASFKDSVEFLAAPENPNREFPLGHFLPIPMQVLETPGSADAWYRLQVLED